MNKLLIGAWIVFALDFVILLLMIRELGTAELSEADREFAVSIIWRFAIWIGAVNLALLVGWWRESRAWLWVALAGGGLPLLWAWAMAVQAITDAASGS
ncbi:MAG: hypothetical protein AB7H90_11625 [Alphaproteobacteria bacterium]